MKRDDAKDVIAKGLEQLHAALAQGASEQLQRYLAVMSKFHRYSWGNVMLILIQNPDATHVAGYTRWKQLGRQVKKGESGIGILAPIKYRRKKASDTDDDETQGAIRGFKVAHVFDVSQTEGDDLPEFATTSGDPGDYLPRLEEAIRQDGIQIVEDRLPPGCNGISSGGTITTALGLADPERFRLLIHEWSHEQLHQGERKHQASKPVKETEAEAVAFVVCNALGIDSAQRSSDYIQLHRGTAETLSESLEFIQRTARRILDALEGDELPEVKASTEKNPEEQPACNHTLYVDDPGSTWTGEASGKQVRYSCSVCSHFYGYQPNGAKAAKQAPQPVEIAADTTTTEDASDTPLRIGRSDYHDRRDARIERLQERADQARKDANATHKRADDMAGVIPFGQPILVGHHSEGRDRRYRERIRKTFLKSFELSSKATRLQSRAQAAESSTAISSDDPEALERLRERVEELEAIQEERKALNAAWRKAKKPKPDDAVGWKRIAAILEVDPKELGYVRMDMQRRSGWGMDDAPSPAYELSNNRQNLTRLKARVAELGREGTITETTEVDHGVCTVVQNIDINRIQLVFPGKPPEEVRQSLKSYGFRWARSEGAWQRQLNQAGRHAATAVVQQLQRQGDAHGAAQPS